MKKVTFLLVTLLFLVGWANAQTLVSTNVQNKNVVLEEYTGIHCTYCPEGHAIGNKMVADNPGRVVLVNVHTGGYAIPGAGEPDFRTTFGDGIAAPAGITGYPSGSINRHVFPNFASTTGKTAMDRGAWTPAASDIMQQISPVNVGVASQYDAQTRLLTVNVELYYTSNAPDANNFINVALLQNDILGPQTGGGMGNNYNHKHMLRDFLTGQWGDPVSTTTTGSFVQRTYTYTIPADYKGVPCIPQDCEIAVYVTQSNHQEIYSANSCAAINGTTLVVGNLSNPTADILQGTNQVASNFNFTMENLVANNEPFQFEIVTNAPASWTVTYTVNGNIHTGIATEILSNTALANISINVTPSTQAAFATFTLKIKSTTVTQAPIIQKETYLVSNVTDLIVHNQGSWSTGNPWDFDALFKAGIAYGGAQTYDATDYKLFKKAINANINFQSIYFNVGWTSPGLTDENVALLSTYLDNGGNLFIAGQDIGWGTWAAQGNGTANTKSFYTNYLNASYLSDGSSANNSLAATATDAIFGTTSASTLVDIYGGNMYPDELGVVGNGQAIFNYGNPAKIAGVKSDNGTFKTVYLGFDPAMVSNQYVAQDILRRTYLWFHGTPIQPAVAFDPVNGVTDFLPDGIIKLYFTEAIRLVNDSPITNPAALVSFSDANSSANIPFTASINLTNDIITVTPSQNLIIGNQYLVQLNVGAENTTNQAVPVANTLFTVFAPAATATFTPANSAINVPVTSVVSLKFNQKVLNADASEITNTNVNNLIIFKKDNAAGADVPFTGHIDFGKKNFTITPSSNLLSNQVYYVALNPVQNIYGVVTQGLSTTFTTQDLTGVTVKDKISFEIYPNPAQTEIFLNTEAINSPFTVVFTDISGRVVYKSENLKTKVNKMRINTSDFSDGIYFVSIRTSDNAFTKKVLIKK